MYLAILRAGPALVLVYGVGHHQGVTLKQFVGKKVS